MDDNELYKLIKGEGATRDQAISQLRSILLRGLSKSLNNRYGKPFNAEDIVQEALMKVLNSLDKYEGCSSAEVPSRCFDGTLWDFRRLFDGSFDYR